LIAELVATELKTVFFTQREVTQFGAFPGRVTVGDHEDVDDADRRRMQRSRSILFAISKGVTMIADKSDALTKKQRLIC
jgi:hypothetical protein